MAVDLSMSLQEVVDMVEASGYSLDKRPNKLNLVGIRDSSVAVPENYSDAIAYLYWDDNGNIQGKVAEATTTPSVYYLQNIFPGAEKTGGSAIMKGGQYKDAYALGLHNSSYEALIQVKPVTVIRDGDRNSILNYFGNTTSGLYGINIHRSTAAWASQDKIGQDSAGCQVFRDRDDFNDMMSLAKKSSYKYGNTFTYTLIDQREKLQKNVNYAIIGGVLIGLGAYFYYLKKKGII
jgi:hypothetical protein